jgi:intracellular sulfur oxidation DsrE/DsrF family protein
MRHLLFASLLLLGTVSTSNATTQSTSTVDATAQKTTGDKYAMLVQNTKSLRSSIMTATEMKKERPNITFEIVIMGQVVQDLNKEELRTELDAANKAGIKLIVCEFALKVFGIELKSLPSYIQGTPNAHKYMFQLQENNYNSLSI